MNEPAAFGTPQFYRDTIAEIAQKSGIYLEIIERYCAIGNDAGLDHAIRCLIATARAQEGICADLKEMKAKHKDRETRDGQPGSPTKTPEGGV
ncbi:hypothetical protein [Methylobacterium oxalidis]|uniref:Uncharacterized protein n=1 Tax=Methylobacterium oxalidis TaxID=944322 RepID=A0A512J3B9_9HYPH|nr:hypothetical protein [Methylobacterium oxalidis]GEP04477.1 hypothetical protein MOX02_25150 [Methylobacterium oxalidis]GJE30554.1 hypothetical protein LDDCCGHA_0723 [Methylobacterium oxalidis]GLS64756.1 hypothetical protein GCM10007888_31370 [Methylobacterium oxalidis]